MEDVSKAVIEKSASDLIHRPESCRFIVEYSDYVKFSHCHEPTQSMAALIMPLYTKSLHGFWEALLDTVFPSKLSISIAFSLFEACKWLNFKQVCHSGNL